MPTRLICLPELTLTEARMLRAMFDHIHSRMKSGFIPDYVYAECLFVFSKAEAADKVFEGLYTKIESLRPWAQAGE